MAAYHFKHSLCAHPEVVLTPRHGTGVMRRVAHVDRRELACAEPPMSPAEPIPWSNLQYSRKTLVIVELTKRTKMVRKVQTSST